MCEVDADETIAAVVQENVLLAEDVVLLVVGEGHELGADEQRAVLADKLLGALHAGELRTLHVELEKVDDLVWREHFIERDAVDLLRAHDARGIVVVALKAGGSFHVLVHAPRDPLIGLAHQRARTGSRGDIERATLPPTPHGVGVVLLPLEGWQRAADFPQSLSSW